jgi:hypothetical protein
MIFTAPETAKICQTDIQAVASVLLRYLLAGRACRGGGEVKVDRPANGYGPGLCVSGAAGLWSMMGPLARSVIPNLAAPPLLFEAGAFLSRFSSEPDCPLSTRTMTEHLRIGNNAEDWGLTPQPAGPRRLLWAIRPVEL